MLVHIYCLKTDWLLSWSWSLHPKEKKKNQQFIYFIHGCHFLNSLLVFFFSFSLMSLIFQNFYYNNVFFTIVQNCLFAKGNKIFHSWIRYFFFFIIVNLFWIPTLRYIFFFFISIYSSCYYSIIVVRCLRFVCFFLFFFLISLNLLIDCYEHFSEL